MRSLKFILSMFFILLYSCSSDLHELSKDAALSNNNISKPYKVPGDGKYDLLGYAFDATGVFLDQIKMPYPVLDTKKLENQSLISGADQVHSELNIVAGSDAKTLLQKYQSKFTVDGSFNIPIGGTPANFVPFTANLSADFTGSNTITNKYTFAFADINVFISHYAIKPYTSIETL